MIDEIIGFLWLNLPDPHLTLPRDLDLLGTDLRSSTAIACTEWSIVRVNQLSIAFGMQ